MPRSDGGPAFPQADLSAYGIGPGLYPMGGMPLRDYIAIHAMQAITAGSTGWMSAGDAPELASRSYAVADAMLAEREKE